MTLLTPQIAILSTPIEEDDTDTKNLPSTPSPQAVDEFESTAITSANRSAMVSRMLSDHLVTVNDEEVIISSSTVTLPELEEIITNYEEYGYNDHHHHHYHTTDTTPQRTPINSPIITTPKHHIPPMLIQHKMLYQSVSSIASPIRAEDYMPQLHVGPERQVVFHTESLGIKISRHTDGYVRVLSVTPYRASSSAILKSEKVREGDIYEGDVVREISDVNLRMPIDSAVWKLTVGLIKMAPRPLRFVVARELEMSVEEEEEEVGGDDAAAIGNTMQADTDNRSTNMSHSMMQQQSPSRNTITTQKDNLRFGPTREIHFFESALGVKLHHNSSGHVQILTVTPYKSFPNSPLARTGEMKEGDLVLEVGGMWDLREPIEDVAWGVLIRFIRETRRPLCMVVADADCLRTVVLEEEEHQGEQQSITASGGTSSDDDDVHDKQNDNSNRKEALDDSTSNETSQQTPELCRVLNEQLSIDALQKELEETKDS